MVAVLALLTAACKIETNAVIDINADRSGVVAVELGFDDEFMEFAAGMADEPVTEESVFEGNELAEIPGAQTSTEARGDMTFYIISVPVDDVTDIERELGADDNQLAQDVEITFTDELVTVNATASGEGALADTGGDAGMIPPDQLEESFAANLRVTMPGKILDHNADSQEGNTLTWAVPLTGGTVEVMAQSDPSGSEGGGGFPIWAIILIAAVVLAAVGYFLYTRSKSGPTAPAPEAAPGAPVEDTPPDNTPAPPPAE
jgi:hypothetical protein